MRLNTNITGLVMTCVCIHWCEGGHCFEVCVTHASQCRTPLYCYVAYCGSSMTTLPQVNIVGIVMSRYEMS